MSSLLEVVFEDVSVDTALLLILFLIDSEKTIKNSQATGFDGTELENTRNLDFFAGILRGRFESVFINTTYLRINEFFAKDVLVCLIKTGEFYDVSLAFESVEISEKSFSESVFLFAKHISEKFGVKNFYGGLEPAIDATTRIFTGLQMGPLKF